MKSVAVRLTLLGLFIVASGVAAFTVWTSESRARHDAHDARGFESAALAVERRVLDLRSAQQAYVAAGQGEEFWISKVAAAIADVRSSLDALRAQAASPTSQSVIDNAAGALQDFEQMDRRARGYMRNGQKLLASDLIFADGLEITGAMVASLEQARAAEVQARDAARAAATRAEAVAIGAAAVVAFLVILLLVPSPPSSIDVRTDRGSKAIPGLRAIDIDDPGPSIDRMTVSPPPKVDSPKPASLPFELSTIAALCSDLARVVDTRALPGLLERTATVLDAPGIVLWIADPDGRELSPIVTHGYSQQMVARLGTILRDAENATASAFRTSLVQTVGADAVSNGALAAPLVTPAGCVGVMAAEVRHEGEKDPAKVAAAAIVAAQLATLVGPPSTRAQARADAV
jgi:CHASE3 domain sensor protein